MALSNEFARFKQWLRDRQATDAVLKVCAVVEANLGEIAQTTHAGGQRTRVAEASRAAARRVASDKEPIVISGWGGAAARAVTAQPRVR